MANWTRRWDGLLGVVSGYLHECNETLSCRLLAELITFHGMLYPFLNGQFHPRRVGSNGGHQVYLTTISRSWDPWYSHSNAWDITTVHWTYIDILRYHVRRLATLDAHSSQSRRRTRHDAPVYPPRDTFSERAAGVRVDESPPRVLQKRHSGNGWVHMLHRPVLIPGIARHGGCSLVHLALPRRRSALARSESLTLKTVHVEAADVVALGSMFLHNHHPDAVDREP